MSKNLSQIEREFLSSRIAGATAQTPINQLRRRFYSEYVGIQSTPTTGLMDLEYQFLRKVIVDNGGTPAEYELWKQAVTALGVQSSQYEHENKRLLYLNLPA